EDEPAWQRFKTIVGDFLGWRAPGGARMEAANRNGAYEFGRCRLDTLTRELRRDGRPVAIEQRAVNMLLYPIEHRDRAISKDELQEAIWPRMLLTESALTRCVMKVRRAVGDDPQRQEIVKTIHGHGYRFIAPLN